MSDTGVIQSRTDFPLDARGWARRWTVEFEAAERWMHDWWDSAGIALEAFLDDKPSALTAQTARGQRWKANLFWANVATQLALLYGRIPSVSVSRRFADADDDEARIGGPVILDRVLNTDIEREEDGFRHSLRKAETDWLIVGYAFAKLRYVAEFEEQPAKRTRRGEAPPVRRKRRGPDGLPIEDVVTDYIHWRDQRWSPCRTHEEMTWWAFGTPMTKDEVTKKWGQKVANSLSYTDTRDETEAKKETNPAVASAWQKVVVWEIWSKPERMVFWFVKGHRVVIDMKKDPYRLRGFWPFPRPLYANLTNERLLPRCDYAMAQDLYAEVDELSSRLGLLERSLRVAGVFDAAAGDLQRLVNEGYQNLMLPVSNWPAFQERGGLKSVMDFLPLEQIVVALEKLRDQRTEAMRLLYEVTGQSDIFRGQAMDSGETATSVRGKVRFASARLQHKQDEFATFATGLQQLRAELMVSLFEDETLLARSNVMRTKDAGEAPAAVQALKQEFPGYRVQVTSDALAQQDFAALKADRLSVLESVARLTAGAQPLIQMLGPQAIPVFLELVKWTIASLPGGATIEGVLDKALRVAQQAAEQAQAAGPAAAPPDPKLLATQAKAQADLQRTAAQTAAKREEVAMEVEADRQRQAHQLEFNVQEAAAQERIKTAGEQARARIKTAAAAQVAAARPARQPGSSR